MKFNSKMKKLTLNVRLPEDIYESIEKIASENNVTRTDVVVSVLRKGLINSDDVGGVIYGGNVPPKEISFAKLFDDAGLLVESSLTPAGYPAVFFSMPFGNGVYRMTHLMESLTERNKLFSLVDSRFAFRFVEEFDGIYSVEDAAFEYGREFSHISNLINSLLKTTESDADAF